MSITGQVKIMKVRISKGTSLLECMRQKLKDKWVLANDVRNKCSRGGGYVREVLEEAAAIGLIERTEELKRQIYYKIDPPEHGDPICQFEPDMPYDESVCPALERAIENCAESRHGNHDPQSEYCDLLHYFKREPLSSPIHRPKMDLSIHRNNVLRSFADHISHQENRYMHTRVIQPSVVV